VVVSVATGAGVEAGPAIRVVVVDDNAVTRIGLRATLDGTADVEVVGEAATGEAAIEVCTRAGPDVVLLDVNMPGMGGLAAARVLATRFQVVMMTLDSEPETIRAALAAGAAGYLVYPLDPAEVIAGIYSAASGSGSFSLPVIDLLRGALAGAAPPAHRLGYGLTKREVEIMDLAATGLRNSEIGEQLFISEKHVKNSISRIFAKLHVTTRAEAVSVWLQGRPTAGP
jgi:DNA-binding NarL/FixJ family response regulator